MSEPITTWTVEAGDEEVEVARFADGTVSIEAPGYLVLGPQGVAALIAVLVEANGGVVAAVNAPYPYPEDEHVSDVQTRMYLALPREIESHVLVHAAEVVVRTTTDDDMFDEPITWWQAEALCGARTTGWCWDEPELAVEEIDCPNCLRLFGGDR